MSNSQVGRTIKTQAFETGMYLFRSFAFRNSNARISGHKQHFGIAFPLYFFCRETCRGALKYGYCLAQNPWFGRLFIEPCIQEAMFPIPF
jgi:hypothetical protein